MRCSYPALAQAVGQLGTVRRRRWFATRNDHVSLVLLLAMRSSGAAATRSSTSGGHSEAAGTALLVAKACRPVDDDGDRCACPGRFAQ